MHFTLSHSKADIADLRLYIYERTSTIISCDIIAENSIDRLGDRYWHIHLPLLLHVNDIRSFLSQGQNLPNRHHHLPSLVYRWRRLWVMTEGLGVFVLTEGMESELRKRLQQSIETIPGCRMSQ